MPIPAVRYIASSTKFALGSIHFQCHVKPGASKQREGIIAISDSVIEICVSAKAREGEANKAVMEVFSKVNLLQSLIFDLEGHMLINFQVLKCPKSDVQIIRGQKSRDKTVAISGFEIKGDEESCIFKVKEQLERAIG